MKMKELRKLRNQAAKHSVRRLRREFDTSDAYPNSTIEADAGPAPEAVFDRITGPYGRRYTLAYAGALGAFDEET